MFLLLKSRRKTTPCLRVKRSSGRSLSKPKPPNIGSSSRAADRGRRFWKEVRDSQSENMTKRKSRGPSVAAWVFFFFWRLIPSRSSVASVRTKSPNKIKNKNPQDEPPPPPPLRPPDGGCSARQPPRGCVCESVCMSVCGSSW